MPGFTVVAVPYFFQAGPKQHELCFAAVHVHGDCPASARSHDGLWMMLVELGLGDADGLDEIFVGQRRIADLVAAALQVRRLHAAGH